MSAGLFFYAALVMSFRYANFYRRETRWKIALETAGMIAFVTWVLWYTDGLASPLLNAYLLPVITAALTLGKVTTLVDVGADRRLLPLPRRQHAARPSSSRCASSAALFAQLAPVLLVAYITTMFSADIRYGLAARQAALRDRRPDRAAQHARLRASPPTASSRQALRHGRAASVLMIDSDNLKSVNDAYGHDAGNALLRQLAAVHPGGAALHRRAGALRRRRIHRAAARDARPRARWRSPSASATRIAVGAARRSSGAAARLQRQHRHRLLSRGRRARLDALAAHADRRALRREAGRPQPLASSSAAAA